MVFTLYVDKDEAIKLLHALQWVKELGFAQCGFAAWFSKVASKFKRKEDYISGLWAIIYDCRHIHSSFFTNSCVEFTRRQTNEVSHLLARAATSYASFHTFTYVSTYIRTIMIIEMNQIICHTRAHTLFWLQSTCICDCIWWLESFNKKLVKIKN